MPSLMDCRIGTWEYDFISDRLSCNREWYELIHRSSTSPLRNLAQFRAIVHNDDLNLVTSERLASLLETKRHKTYLRLIGGDGEIRTVLCSASLMEDFDQKNPHFSGTMVDVTEALHRDVPLFPGLGHQSTLDFFLATMEQLRCAAVAINDQAEVVGLNRAAEQFLLDGPLVLIERRLAATSPEVDLRLRTFISRICSAPNSEDGQRIGPIGFRRSGRRPLVIQGQMLGGRLSEGPPYPKAILGLVDLEASGMPRAEHVRAAFGLTVAESRLVIVLMDHFRLGDAARTLGISHETARTQLRNVFLKTGARNQADLLVMLERLGRGTSEFLSYATLIGAG